ncbi:MAG: GTPase-associated protein 1-related protein [Streptosporangiaceae bacterium]
MAFEQLYYTSCERGVSGYAGFQFNALSPGARAAIMRPVEQLTTYELPSWDTSPDDAPVNLCHVPGAARGGDITARVVYAGTDFSGRSGNYFAHALVTEHPQRDFDGLLPVELWESPVWSRTPADGTVLPVLPAPPPRGSFDRPAVDAFLAAFPGDAQGGAEPTLARLLTAADQALGGGRALVLWCPTSTDNAYWIAAISYLLDDARARELSFYTYTRRPAQCRAHVIGTVPGAITSPAALADGFRVYDMTTGTQPDVTTHPAATLLAQVGVLHAAGLWRQAATLAAGTERSLDEWYPVLAAAAALLAVKPLPAGAVGAMAGWLPQAARRPAAPLPAPHVDTVLGVLLDQASELGDDQLRHLLDAARAAGAVGPQQQIEVILVDRAAGRLAGGQPTSGPTPATTTEGIEVAVANCERLLGSADAATALTVLDWARETGLKPDPGLVERCGRDVIGPALLALNADRRIVRTGRAYPALARGLAAFITAAGPQAAPRLLRGVAGELLDAHDLRGHPELREMLLLEEVRSRRLPPVQALRELVELRPAASPLADTNLIAGLWPRGLTTPGEAGQLLALLDGNVRGTPALGLLDRALQPPRHIDHVGAWFDLCAQALDHPVCAQLPAATRLHLTTLHGLRDTREGLRHAITHGDMEAYLAFEDRVERLPFQTRDLMRQYLAYLTITAARPAELLAACADPVFQAICGHVRARLGTPPPDHQLAARLFQARYDLRGARATARRGLLLQDDALAPTVPGWRRHDRGQVTNILKKDARLGPFRVLTDRRDQKAPRRRNLSRKFRRWCRRNAAAARAAPQVAAGLAVAGGEPAGARTFRWRVFRRGEPGSR